MENLEYETLAKFEKEIREELEAGDHKEEDVVSQVEYDLDRYKSLWNYLDAALAVRASKLHELLEEGGFDPMDILVKEQRNIAETAEYSRGLASISKYRRGTANLPRYNASLR